ncbi:MAG: DUF1559 domain-containing protein [Planctomycetales bacterium]|nr:DUF1559 domain-containing protein [Planctomycetales bacterium]
MVATIFLLAFALAAPATQLSRESARRATCTDHLRQIGLALNQYVETTHYYPAVITRTPKHHGWTPYALPFLGQQTLFDRYDFSVHWCDPVNADVIKTPIKQFECPAATYPNRMAVGETQHPYQGAVLDYLATNRVSPAVTSRGWLPESTEVKGVLSREEWCRTSDILDGQSHTTLIVEVAGTPAKYVFRQKEPEPMYRQRGFGAWADAAPYIQGHGQQPNGRDWPGPCTINCTNDDAIYSFHPDGANFLFADGAVRYMSDNLDLFVLLAAITRANGEVIDHQDW